MVYLVNSLGDQLVKATFSGVINLTAKMDNHGHNNVLLTRSLHDRICALEAILYRIEDRIIYTPGSQSVADVFEALPTPVFPI